MNTLTISQCMTEFPHSIGKAQSMTHAHELMRKHRLRHLPVLDGGQILGVVTERDLHLMETLRDVDPNTVTVEDAMTADPYVVTPHAKVQDVARHMADKKIGCAVVMEGNHLKGIFTTVDALHVLARVLDGKTGAK